MTTKRIRLLENPKGVGIVYRGEESIARVRYELRVWQEVHVVETFGGTTGADGLTHADGSLTVIDGEPQSLWVDNPLILELDDRRRMEFLAHRYDPMAGRYQIRRTGDWLNPK